MKRVKSTLPTVTLVGRANVGKSTLFNRLTEEKRALVSTVAGTTRDRKEGLVTWRGEQFRIIDTGGLQSPDGEFDQRITDQTQLAIKEANVVLFVVDLRDGLLEQDRVIGNQLRNLSTPVFLVANKADSMEARSSAHDKEWYSLSFGDPHPVSAVRGNGLGDLLDLVRDAFMAQDLHARPYEDERPLPRIAFIGEPNVGKSSIMNQIMGEDRFITSPIAHTTREPNDTLVSFDQKEYLLIDTAGIRRKAKVTSGLESTGVKRSLNVLKTADIAVLVLDATKKIDSQEKRLADLITSAGVGCIIVLNKWDLVSDKGTNTINEYEEYIRHELPHLRFAPILTTSAKDRIRIHKLFPLFDTIMQERVRRITPAELETFLAQTIARHKPARGKGVAHPKILQLGQVAINPPRFELVIKGSRTDVLHQSYTRFLENQLRDRFGFKGTPIIFYALPSKKAA